MRSNLEMLKIIFKNIFSYLKLLKLNYNKVEEEIHLLIGCILKRDQTYDLFGIKF